MLLQIYIYIFAKTSVFWANILRQITIKMHSKIHQINHYSKMSCSCKYMRKSIIFKISWTIIIPIPACSQVTPQITLLFNIFPWDIIVKNDLKPHNMQALT